MRALKFYKMKKTKTGLYIQTRNNRIEVFTENEFRLKQQKDKSRIINTVAIICIILIGSIILFI